MEYVFNEQSNIGEVVTKFPKAGDLFKSYRIDFCCGGNRPLIDAINERNLSAEEVVGKLNELYYDMKERNKREIDWNSATYTELIEHIVNKHHRYLNEELPQLTPSVTKVLRVHGAEHTHLSRVHTLFNQLKSELEQHTIKEDTEVFPLILEFEKNPDTEILTRMKNLIEELESEHDGAGDIIKELRDITNDFTPPFGACGTYRLVYQRLEHLESDLFQHIHLEKNILFPRAAAQN